MLLDQKPKKGATAARRSATATTSSEPALSATASISTLARSSLVSKFSEIVPVSVSRLMQPPRRGTVASTRYKALVAARIPGKRNQYREDHHDKHYLFAQVAYRREFSAMFSEECAIFSADR